MKTKVGLVSAAVLLVTLCSSITSPFAAPGPVLPGSGDLLQYRSGGHIMGFQSNKVYLVSMDHALSVEFIGGSGNGPQELSSGGTGSGKGPKTLGRVEYKNLWAGITLRYDKVIQGIVESTYTVQPGADVSKIRLKYNVPVTLREDGALKFGFSSGDLTESAPMAWQELEGKRRPVEVTFRIDDGMVGFAVGKYDRTHPLIIDPTYQWHTFYGSTGPDVAYGIAVDVSGNIFVTGGSYTGWSGPTGQSPLHAFSGNNYNIFVLMLNSSGDYRWHTFYGSGDYNVANGIAIDGSGNVYVTGESLTGWKGPADQSPLNSFTGSKDIFVLKLTSSGDYFWHTFYGSNGDDYAKSVAIDNSGNLYLTGHSAAGWKGPANQSPLHAYSGSFDIFVLKLNSSGAYQWHSFYGTDNYDGAFSIAIDGSSNVYVTGESGASWNGPTGQPPLHAFNGSMNFYVLKLGSSGAYQWHTFYGGYDFSYGIAIDSSSNVYVTGESSSTWNGPTGQSPLHAFNGDSYSIYALKLTSNGNYLWHTFYGSGSIDAASGAAVDSSGNLLVTGYSSASWNGPTGQPPLNAFSGTRDIVVFKLDSSGTFQWHTFYGSGGYDSANGVGIDGSGNAYLTGWSDSNWTGPTGQSPLNAYSGNWDIFVLKLNDQGGQGGSVRIMRGGSLFNSFATLQDAGNAAVDGDTIQAQALYFTENPIFADNSEFSFHGGYDSAFVLNPGMTTLIGSLTISNGALTLENLTIK